MSDIRKPISLGVIILGVSIALNGLLAGLLIAKQNVPHHPQMDMNPPNEHIQMAIPNDPRRLLKGLPIERRKEVMKNSVQHLGLNGRKQHRQLIQKIRTARRAVSEQMSAQPINAAALREAMDALVLARSALNEASNEFTLAVLQELTPQERKTALQTMRDRVRNKRRDKVKTRRRRD